MSPNLSLRSVAVDEVEKGMRGVVFVEVVVLVAVVSDGAVVVAVVVDVLV